MCIVSDRIETRSNMADWRLRLAPSRNGVIACFRGW